MYSRIMALLVAALATVPGSVGAAILTEDFEATFPTWESGWFGAGSDAYNFYCSRPCPERGNNPDGLWLGGVNGSDRVGDVEVRFSDAFGAMLSSFAMDVAAFDVMMLRAYDMSDNLIFEQEVEVTEGAYVDPGIYVTYVIHSANGIRRFTFDNFAAGYVSVDNLVARTSAAVPEPGPLALLGLGLAGLSLRRRRRDA